MEKAKIISNGNLNLENVKLEKKALAINKNLKKVVDDANALIANLAIKNNALDFDQYYTEIENAIICWSNNGTRTAGTLTRIIIGILKKKR